MICKSCRQNIESNSTFCKHCGHKQKRKTPSVYISLLVIVASILSFYYFYDKLIPIELASNKTVNEHLLEDSKMLENETQPETITPTLSDEEKRINLIEQAQKSVYTVYTSSSQGSAFLYDQNGSVITNAHVVEGSIDVLITTVDGEEHSGTVIGYSNTIDVAVIHVPALVGAEPFPLEKSEKNKIGEEVIALGTPLGYENTATVGFITGTDRDFTLGDNAFTYENIYQISAPIEPGNSGGPLLSTFTEKIIAINSAKSVLADNIGFSIPLYEVVPLIDSWIEQPMTEDEIISLFQYYDDYYFYDYIWGNYDSYFNGGYFTDDELYYYYWLYDYYDNTWNNGYDYDWEWYEDYDSDWNWEEESYEYEDWELYEDVYEYDEYEDWDSYEDIYEYDEDWDMYEDEYYDYENWDSYEEWYELDDDWMYWCEQIDEEDEDWEWCVEMYEYMEESDWEGAMYDEYDEDEEIISNHDR